MEALKIKFASKRELSTHKHSINLNFLEKCKLFKWKKTKPAPSSAQIILLFDGVMSKTRIITNLFPSYSLLTPPSVPLEDVLAIISLKINCCIGRYPDFKSSVANHFTFCLKCQMNCAQKLNNLRGEVIENLVPNFYHYLQFGYYHGKFNIDICNRSHY